MGVFRTLLGTCAGVVAIFAVLLGVVWHLISVPSEPPTISIKYWGPGKAKPDKTDIVPFKINISKETLDDLQTRLKLLPHLTPPLEDANFQYGFNSNFLQKVVEFWLKDYNWRERETFLNSLPHFKTQIAGLNLHFIHKKPSKVPTGVSVLPLLLLHGWPGSVREFYDLIPLLTTPRPDVDFVFEVVAPSLPGFGFSDGASKQGLGATQMAVMLNSLMQRIGFKKFYVQGGDWGAVVGSHLSILYPGSVLGYHSNFCITKQPRSLLKYAAASIWPNLFLTDTEVSRFRNILDQFLFNIEESGYFHIQATKPDTIGTALTSSPVGLAAYILEKFSTGTNPDWRLLPDGGLTRKFTLTNLLDNVMIYWVTSSMTTAMRIYSESVNKAQFALNIERSQQHVPSACARFPNEIEYTPEFILKDKFVNLVQVSDMAHGGHFAAFEEPTLLANDVWTAIEKMKKLSQKK